MRQTFKTIKLKNASIKRLNASIERLDKKIEQTKKSIDKTNDIIEKLQKVIDTNRELIDKEKNELDELIEVFQKTRLKFDTIGKEIEIFFEGDEDYNENDISIEALRKISLIQNYLYSQFKLIKQDLSLNQDILINKQNHIITLYKAQNERQESMLKLKDEITDQLKTQTKQNQKMLKKHQELLKESQILKKKECYYAMLKKNFAKQFYPGLTIIS